jgi:predicted DNA-binding ribbon-helix-helix protein
MNELVAEIDTGRSTNLSSALRVYVLKSINARPSGEQR